MYDKAVNRKSKVHFNPRQTLDYLKSDIANVDLSYDTKKNIVKQYLDVSIQYYVLSSFLRHFSLKESVLKLPPVQIQCSSPLLFDS